MGLGAPKRRNKLAHDPNNTSWAKSADNYGHRLLTQQGWKAGDYLGAKDANHSDHYTGASASHIKAFLREEGLGLGAELGTSNAETFGLSLFSGVLGRLNGQSDETLQKKQGHLRDAELRTYQAQKHGVMNFVSGGLLVGTEIQPVAQEVVNGNPTKAASVGAVQSSHRSRKRKAIDGAVDGEGPKKSKTKRLRIDTKSVSESEEVPDPKSAMHEGRKKAKKQKRPDISGDAEVTMESSIGEKRSKKRDKKREINATEAEEATTKEKAKRKDEKRARKEARRKQKEQKRRSKKMKASSAGFDKADQHRLSTVLEKPSLNGRQQSVRSRYIAQKRMASMDPQAMKEIFMLTAAG